MKLSELIEHIQVVQGKYDDDPIVMMQSAIPGEYYAPYAVLGGKINDEGPSVAILVWYDPAMVDNQSKKD